MSHVFRQQVSFGRQFPQRARCCSNRLLLNVVRTARKTVAYLESYQLQ